MTHHLALESRFIADHVQKKIQSLSTLNAFSHMQDKSTNTITQKSVAYINEKLFQKSV